ncbi:hypothetical protein EPN52_10940 [bacterium]|nr:MAG: hypothetical protein EPN52_10940 [bacterium]
MRLRTLPGALAAGLVLCLTYPAHAAEAPSAPPSPSVQATATAEPVTNQEMLPALLAKMSAVNSGLRTYEASITVQVTMHTFPYLNPTLTGHVYWSRPDRSAVVFDTLPVLANQFKKVYPRVEAPSQWTALYVVSLISPDHVRLVPRKHGRIDHLDVAANPDGTVASMHWYYNDGGDVELHQTFALVSGRLLVTAQHGTVDLPSYKGVIQAAFSGYKINVKIPDTVFAS